MLLLEAVNLILRALGEHPVTTVDTRHPTVQLALSELDARRRIILLHGYWFNHWRCTLSPDISGYIYIPTGTMSFQADESNRFVILGSKLYDTLNDTDVITNSVSGTRSIDVAFEDMPVQARVVVANQAAIKAYGVDIGLDSNAQMYQAEAQEALDLLNAEHSRQRNFSSRQRLSWRKYERTLWG